MKKILLAAVLACACLQTANAQKPQRSFENKKALAEKMVDRMDDALDLNDKQEKDLLNLYTEMFSKKATAGDKQSRINARKEFTEKVNAILTADQQKKWAEYKAKQGDKEKNAFKKDKEYKKSKVNRGEFAEKMVDLMDDALDLSDEQEKELLAVYTEMFSKNAKAGDKQSRINKRKEFTEKINSILTADQQKKWAEIQVKQAEKRKEAFKARKQSSEEWDD